ncbi:uncharacterized protein LOC124543529 [Vanessa cardui]|uniref:uncharacterized protein LOC124543529 n=1 Tax=Vanessa cardui TaxID=171605 RepID=UPI001F1379D1|nr:uncharacterized protein LOC124543529 [Vanessa cardui]
MINSILKSTKGKPCSCPSGKICSNCTPKKSVHPHVTNKQLKQPPRLENGTYQADKKYKQSPTIVQFFEKPRWRIRKRQKFDCLPSKSTTICRWYRRRKALKQLIKEHEKEKELLRKKKREEFERERLIDFINWNEKKHQTTNSKPPSLKSYKWEKTIAQRNHSSPPPQKKFKHIKNKTAIVKPRAHSKYASVKQHNPRDSITTRFVNYCYRFCCQLYCYLTCIVIITFIVIFIV